MDKLSYALGLGIGRQLAQMGASNMNIDDFAAAIKDVIAGGDLKMTNREAQAIVQDYFAKQEEKLNAERAEQGKAAKAEGEAEQPMAAWEKELLTEGAPAAEAPAEAEGETKAE